MISKSRHFVALDSWRGICALIVAAFHFPASGFITTNAVVSLGQLFVDFFFVLSGFVIAANYMDRLSGPRQVVRFLWLRVGRLYPLHLAIFLAYFGFEILKAGYGWNTTGGMGDAFTGDRTLGMAVSNLFLIQSMGLHSDVSWNRPSWSISTELFAYLAFACLTLWSGRGRWIAYALAALTSILVLIVFNDAHLLAMHDFGFFRCLAGFLTGVFVWRIWKAADQRIARLTIGQHAWTLLEVIAVLIVGTFVANFVVGWPSLFTPIVFGFAVLVFAVEGGAVSRVLKHRTLTLLGLLSYSIYMVHQLLIDRMLNFAVFLDARVPLDFASYDEDGLVRFFEGSPLLADALTIAFLAVLVGISWLTYRVIEAPFRDWFRDIPIGQTRQIARPDTVPAN